MGVGAEQAQLALHKTFRPLAGARASIITACTGSTAGVCGCVQYRVRIAQGIALLQYSAGAGGGEAGHCWCLTTHQATGAEGLGL
jgi:hypothetical protein